MELKILLKEDSLENKVILSNVCADKKCTDDEFSLRAYGEPTTQMDKNLSRLALRKGKKRASETLNGGT
ncbi:hypothetical protein ACTXT7_011595 [Hymenolepis weldensis]